MIYNDTVSGLGIVNHTDYLCFGSSTANTTEYPLADKARNINKWYRTVMSWIFEACGNWSFDDSNYTNLPIAESDCVLGQHDYSFPSDYVEIERIEYKDSVGTWHLLIPKDRTEIEIAVEEYQSTNGTPIYYDKFANSFNLYPAPDRTSSDGDSIKVYHTRDAALASAPTASATGGPFVAASTTVEPGFNRLWHPVLAYGAAYEYCIANSRVEKLPILNVEIEKYKLMIKESYANRKKDEIKRLQVAYQNNK